MDQSAAVWLVLLVALVAANAPFFSERVFFLGPRLSPKGLGWRLAELALMALLSVGLGFVLEARAGQRHPQGWEFFAAGLCLFLTLAFPGFVWRYLRRQRHA